MNNFNAIDAGRVRLVPNPFTAFQKGRLEMENVIVCQKMTKSK